MTTRLKILLTALALLSAYGFGRWSAPEKIITVEVEKKSTVTDTQKNEHKTVVIVQKPDGTKTTTITQDKNSDSRTAETEEKNKSTEITREASKVSVMGLAAFSVTKPVSPDYGLLVSKPVVGPLTLGAFGFKSGIVGFAVGLTF